MPSVTTLYPSTRQPATSFTPSSEALILQYRNEAQQAAEDAQAAAAIVSGDLLITGIPATTVPAPVMSLQVFGYDELGDGGSCELTRSDDPVVSAWNFQSADGAYWKIVPKNNSLDVCMFGAKKDGSADAQPAFMDALEAAYTLGVGFVDFGPGTYRMDSRIDQSDYSGVFLRGDRTATLDYSGASAPWENSTYNGLIYASGTKSSAYDIVGKAYKSGRRLSVSTITVSGGVATATCSTAHGLDDGDLVHVGGQTSSTPSNQRGLFSQPFQPFGLTGDVPHKITVSSSTVFTYPTTATADLSASVTVSVATNAIELDTGMGANFANGDIVLIDNGVQLTGGGGTTHDGESNRVKLVSGDILVFSHSVEVDIDPANSPVIYNITAPKVGAVGGFLILGKGYNTALTGSYYGQVGLRYSYCDEPEVDIRTHYVDQTGAEFRSCVDGRLKIKATFDVTDEGGRVTALEKIQYGGSFANACRNCTAYDCHVWDARHGWIISFTNAEHGRSWGCRIVNSEFGGCWYGCFNTQNSNGSVFVDKCRFSGRGEAINHRAGRITVTNCESFGCRSFFSMWRRPESVVLIGNEIRNCHEAAIQFSNDFIEGYWPHFEMNGGYVDGAEYGVYLIPLSSITTDRNFSIKNVSFKNIRKNGIYLRGDGYLVKGEITGNRFENVGLDASTMCIRIQDGVNMDISDNKCIVGSGTVSRVVYIEGSSSAGIVALNNRAIGTVTYVADFTTGSGHRGDNCAQADFTPTNTSGDLTVRVLLEGRKTKLRYSAEVSNITTTSPQEGDEIVLMRSSGSNVVKHAYSGGNIRLAGSADFTPAGANSTLSLRYSGSIWYEIARAA